MSTLGSPRRLTLRGGAGVETKLRRVLAEIADALSGVLRPSDYRALVVIGGYGRGEGGVLLEGGEERPHNNIDLLLITELRSRTSQPNVRAEMDRVLKELARQHDLDIDLSTVSAWKLERSPCLVIWYDMRFGHQTILGNAEYVPALERFRVDAIVPSDIRNLLVNRGTLLLINDVLIERAGAGPKLSRALRKNVAKAVIGYGDALLFFVGEYHWSYAEKQRRMRSRTDLPEALRLAYDQAAEFRFRPGQTEGPPQDTPEQVALLRQQLGEVHLRCESLRLGRRSLSWAEYPECALTAALREGLGSPRGLARKARAFLRGPAHPRPASFAARLGFRCGGTAELLALAFPVVAYDLPAQGLRRLAARALGASSLDISELRRAYLRTWGAASDAQVFVELARYGVSLDRNST